MKRRNIVFRQALLPPAEIERLSRGGLRSGSKSEPVNTVTRIRIDVKEHYSTVILS